MICGDIFTAQGQRQTCTTRCRDKLKAERFPPLPAHKCEYELCDEILPSAQQNAYRKFCSKGCQKNARTTGPRRSVDAVSFDGNYLQISGPKIRDHPAINKWGIVRVHVMLAYDKYGTEDLHCHWCERELDWMFGKFQKDSKVKKVYVDHVDTNKFNNWFDNLVLACVSCNMSRSRTFESRSIAAMKAVQTNNGPGACSVCGDNFPSRMSYAGHTTYYGCKGSHFIAESSSVLPP